ncbi:MAG: enoyl-CoA hydratase/isomerase family protein [Deltaproteobacteria bacterium]|nr:enoyl-CoA hydratase/isomerase family protein [Deltaproteobacteria bacterium]
MGEKNYQTIGYEKNDRIATITLNRPTVRNAINQEMASELIDALSDFKEDQEAKVGILTGAGEKIFCAGGDIAMFFEKLAKDSQARYDWVVTGEEITRLLMERTEKPIIAAVNGHCLAGGLELALACDFIVAAENAKFGLAEINIGLLPGWGGTTRLLRAIPVRKAREMIYLGEPIDAQQAEGLGLVNRVTPPGRAYETTLEIARKIAAKSSYTLRLAKKALTYGSEVSGMDVALFVERGAASLASEGEGFQEGIAAFLEKRPPQFK